MQCPIENGGGTDLFMDYGAGTLAPEVAANLERHMAVCPVCRRVADAQKAVWTALDDWTPLPVSADFDAKLYRRIAADSERPWYQRWFDAPWAVRPAMPVAAACAALIAAFVLNSPFMEMKNAPRTTLTAEKKIDIEQVERALDDIDMLKQLGVVPSSSGQSVRSRSM